MTDGNLEARASTLLLALYQIREGQHPQLSEKDIDDGIIQTELTIEVSKAMPALGIEDQEKFIKLVSEVIPYLYRKGLVADLWSPSTEGYIAGLKLTHAGIRHAEYLVRLS